MRFEEGYGGWQQGRLTQEEAARLLGVCERTFRRHIDRYEDEGLDGLIDKRLSQVSHRQAPVDEVVRLVDCYRERHEGWNAKHFLLLTVIFCLRYPFKFMRVKMTYVNSGYKSISMNHVDGSINTYKFA
jgi:hypothetical protein